VQDHIIALTSAGMSTSMISDRSGCGIGTDTVGKHRDRKHKGMMRKTYDALMSVQVEQQHEFPGARGGPKTDPLESMRKLQALAAIGYGFNWMTAQLGSTNRVSISTLSKGEKQYVMYRTHYAICALYAKYRYVDPVEAGICSATSALRQRNLARNRGYAPPGAWDDDNIADPLAVPEWTGACGSEKGYNLHRSHDIPQCRRCVAAHSELHREQEDRRDTKAGKPLRRRRTASSKHD